MALHSRKRIAAEGEESEEEVGNAYESLLRSLSASGASRRGSIKSSKQGHRQTRSGAHTARATRCTPSGIECAVRRPTCTRSWTACSRGQASSDKRGQTSSEKRGQARASSRSTHTGQRDARAGDLGHPSGVNGEASPSSSTDSEVEEEGEASEV